MPAAPQGEAPSISRIYAAFDDDSYRAFRRAMARSRGGVVRVDDLLAALAETQPVLTASVLGFGPDAVARLTRLPAVGPDLLPMVNEPALRTALADAFTSADGGTITPAVLLGAVARSLAAARQPWRQPEPSAASAPVRPSQPVPESPTPAGVEAVLQRWLEVQSWPAADRDSALRALATLSPPRVESPGSPFCRGSVERATDAPGD